MSETIGSTPRAVDDTTVPIVRTLATFGELTKPRLATLLLLVTLGTYLIAARVGDTIEAGPGSVASRMPGGGGWLGLVVLAVGVSAFAAGMFALNHYLERDIDRLMPRTAGRPLPSGRMQPQIALTFGICFSAIGTGILTLWVGVLCGVFAVANLIIYLGLYTPLKRRTPAHTTIGAFAGAMPPLVGWTAATGTPSAEAWALAAIVFAWQFPHFYSVQLKNLSDYRRADLKVLPVIDLGGQRVRRQILAWSVMTLLASLLPVPLELVHPWYALPATALWIGFAYRAISLCRHYDRRHARLLLRASVTYLPLVFVAIGLALR